MKKENIVILAFPIIAFILLMTLSDFSDIELFVTKDQDEQSVDKKVAEEQLENYKYNDELESTFDNYDNIYQEEYSAFKEQIEFQWGEFETPLETEWVSYVDKGNVRRSVDYKTGKISVEVLLDENEEDKSLIKRKMEKEVFALLNTTEAEAFKADVVSQRVEARLPSDSRVIEHGLPGDNRLFSLEDLTSVTFNYSGIVKVSNKNRNFVTNDIRQAKVTGKKIFRSSFKIQESVLQKAIQYADSVGKFSQKQKIPTALIFAIIESESSFNPMAKSHIPAYGLMQIVPRSAGRDATKHLYGKEKVLAPSYLYSTENNINVGSAYLHVLYHKYLRKVKDPQSRIYCAIAAYNTGATNVARAFIKKKNFNQAVKRINQMTSEEVYETLVNRLPYRETRHYVKKVSNKMKKYL